MHALAVATDEVRKEHGRVILVDPEWGLFRLVAFIIIAIVLLIYWFVFPHS
jgi:hypothetical protein